MNLFFICLFKKIYNKFFDRAYFSQKISYSQCGEDLIVDFLLSWVLGIKNPCYLDIGAHHPHNFNNTYLLYKRGSIGVNIEPDPLLCSHIKKMRPNDITINKGVGFSNKNEIADFYVMSSKALNTFSKSEAERMSRDENINIEEIIKVELININAIFEEYFLQRELDFLSIDVEGLDLAILKSLDFGRHRPKVICIETIVFTYNEIIKETETIHFLLQNGYASYADTSINTIFVRNDLLKIALPG